MIKSHFHVQSGTIWAVQNMSCAKNQVRILYAFPSTYWTLFPVLSREKINLVIFGSYSAFSMSCHVSFSPREQNLSVSRKHIHHQIVPFMTLEPNGGMGRLQVTSLLCVFLSPPVQSGHWGQFKGTKNCHWFFLNCNIICQHYDAMIWHYLLIKQLRL